MTRRAFAGVWLWTWAASCTGAIEGGVGMERGARPVEPGATVHGGAGGGPGSDPRGGAGGGVTPPITTECGFTARRIWKLTPEQYSRSVEALLPDVHRAGDAIANSLTVSSSDAFSNESAAMALTGPHVNDILKSSFALAKQAAADPGKLLPCLAGAAPGRDCLSTFVSTYGAKAFRRDLQPDELGRLVDFVAAQAAGGDLREAVKQLFLYLFSSPHFLFRTELGADDGAAGAVALTPFETAAALSYFVTDGPPDAELFAAARTGALAGKPELEAQARRLLARPDGATGLVRAYREHFRSDVVTGLQKDAEAFAAWTPALAADLAAEADGFIRQVLWHEGGKLQTLLTAPFSMLNAPLAAFYGVDPKAVAGAELRKVTLPAGQRAGLVTMAGIMAAQAVADQSNPIRRGLYVRETFLCQPVPEPPPTLNVVIPKQDGMRQWRERLKIHDDDPKCAGCHAQMDPIGLAFEHYDGIGRYRAQDLGRPLDTSGVLTGAGATDQPFADAVGLAAILGRTPEVGTCLLGSAFRYAQGRALAEGAQDRCALERLATRLDASGGDLLELAVAITTDESFVLRR